MRTCRGIRTCECQQQARLILAIRLSSLLTTLCVSDAPKAPLLFTSLVMFDAFRRAKAVSVVKTMLHQMLAPLTVLGETIPSTIYEDPYVLGYLTAIAGFGTQMATQGKLSV